MNHFEVFELPRKLGIDTAELQRRFYALSRRWHPDFHQAAPPEAQARALEASARLNAAYRTLRDPIARVEYLVRLEEGRPTREGAAVGPTAPPELLEEMFEIQEALAEAKAGGLDADGHRRLAAAWDAADAGERPRVLAACKQALATRAYLRTVIDDLTEALGESQEGHVTHRRH